MAPQNAEMITQRTRLAWDLEATFDAYIDHGATGYEAYLAPMLEEGETLPDCRHHMTLLKRRVSRHREELEKLTGNVWDGVSENDKLSINVSSVVDAFLAKMRSVRHTTRGLFGPDVVRVTGLKGRFPTIPDRLYHRGKLVQTNFLNPDPSWKSLIVPASEGEGSTSLTLADLAKHLEPEIDRLATFVTSRYEGNRSVQDLRALRKLAIEDFDSNIRGVVRIASGILRLAGRVDAANRFRDTLRYIRRRSVSQGVQGAEDSAPHVSQEPDGSSPTDTAPAPPVDPTP